MEELTLGQLENGEEVTSLNTITDEDVKEAIDILNKYKAQKANLDSKIVSNMEWWKGRYHNHTDKDRLITRSSWLHSCIDNKVADYMDNIPEPNILAKEEDDEELAKQLTSIIPVVMDEVDFEDAYYHEAHYKVLNGTGAYSCTWDATKLNGLGDISIKSADILNLYWDTAYSNIQESPNFFSVELMDNKQLEIEYPQLKDKLGHGTISKTEYINDESIDTSNKSYVVDWYYKVKSNGKEVVHLAKFVNDILLSATENEAETATEGLYRDGKYPYVFDPLFLISNSATGYGYVDIGKDPQLYIDKMGQANLENAIMQATPRWLVRDDAEVDEKDLADPSKHFIKVGESIGTDSVMPVQVNSISSSSFNMYQQKIDEMKETTGNRDVSTGGTASGVTAASAISAMQEAGSKTSRMQIRGTYRAYKELVTMIIERIRQFYDLPRTFRIVGNKQAYEYVTFSNAKMQEQVTGLNLADGSEYYRLPCFDIEVNAAKASPYSKMAQNEMAIQLYQLGVFAPENADQALALLDAMDINHKDKLVSKVEENQTMLDTINQLTQALATANDIIYESTGVDLMGGMMPNVMPQSVQPSGAVNPEQPTTNQLGETEDMNDNSIASKARKKVAESTSPV